MLKKEVEINRNMAPENYQVEFQPVRSVWDLVRTVYRAIGASISVAFAMGDGNNRYVRRSGGQFYRIECTGKITPGVLKEANRRAKEGNLETFTYNPVLQEAQEKAAREERAAKVRAKESGLAEQK